MTDVGPEPITAPGEDPFPGDELMSGLVLDHLPFSVFWKNRDGRIVGVNKTMLDTFAVVDRNNILGRRLADLIPDGQQFDDLHTQVMETGQTIIHEDFRVNVYTAGDKQLRRSLVPL